MGAWRRGAAAVGLAAVVCAVFWPALGGGFVHIDDPAYVTANPVVRQGLTPGAIAAVVRHDTASMWVPLAMLSHLADVSCWGLDPWGHHLTSVLLHAATAAALFLTLHAMTGAFWRSALAAALFGLHPLRVESVAWIAERKDVLSGLFAVLAIEAYRRWTRRPSPGRLAGVAALLALGILAKPMVVTLPALFILLDRWPLGRGSVGWGRLVREKAPLFAVALAGAVATIAVVGRTGGMLSASEVPVSDRIANAIVSYGRYLGLTLWPAGLAVYYPRPPAWPLSVVGTHAALLAALAAGAVVLRRRAPYLGLGLAWFGIALLPVSGLVQAGAQAMADRFTYLPSIGLAIAAAWALGELARVLRVAPPAVAGAVVVLVLAMVGQTRAQIAYWHDDRALFEHALSVTGPNWFVHAVYGDALLAQGALADAAAHYERALAIEPALAKVHANLGIVRLRMGEAERAVRHLVEALRLRPDAAVWVTPLARALGARGLDGPAAEQVAAALRSGLAASRRDAAQPAGRRYHAEVARHLMTRHTSTVARCREAGDAARPFDLFVTVAASGAVTEAAALPPSAVGACVAGGIAGSRLPPPPFAPFHARLAMDLAG